MNGPELVKLLGSWLSGTGITLLELRTAEETIRLVRHGDAAQSGRSHPPLEPSPVTVASPCPGVFLDRHPLQAERLAIAGRAVRAGEAIGLVQVGALLLHVAAPVDGTVSAVLAAPGETVGYGSALLRLQRRAQE